MEPQNVYSDQIAEFIKRLNELSAYIIATVASRPRLLNGKRYITGKVLANKLHISVRTLQEYRVEGLLGYVRISGKILYKESDVINLLENNYISAWER